MHNEERSHFLAEFAIASATGLLYGVTNTFVGHPLDTIKTVMHTEARYAKETFRRSTIAFVKENGLKALYRGVQYPLAGSCIYRSLQFSVFELFYTMFRQHDMLQSRIPGMYGLQYTVVAAGFLASTARAVVESPFEYMKVRRMRGEKWQFRDAFVGFRYQFYRTSGLMTSYFIMIDSLRRHTTAFNTTSGQFIASGGCATIAFWLIWPFEIMKNRAQGGVASTTRRSTYQMLKLAVAEHGWRNGLFRGIVPGSISIFFRNGASMIVMQWANRKATQLGLRG